MSSSPSLLCSVHVFFRCSPHFPMLLIWLSHSHFATKHFQFDLNSLPLPLLLLLLAAAIREQIQYYFPISPEPYTRITRLAHMEHTGVYFCSFIITSDAYNTLISRWVLLSFTISLPFALARSRSLSVCAFSLFRSRKMKLCSCVGARNFGFFSSKTTTTNHQGG